MSSKETLLEVADGPEGIKIYVDVGAMSPVPAVYLEASMHNVCIKIGPFRLASIYEKVKAAVVGGNCVCLDRFREAQDQRDRLATAVDRLRGALSSRDEDIRSLQAKVNQLDGERTLARLNHEDDIKIEREACAKVATDHAATLYGLHIHNRPCQCVVCRQQELMIVTARRVAEAISARGEA